MHDATKEQFREIYFRLGGGEGRSGWTQDYWNKFFESAPTRPMKYKIEEPASPAHTSMMIVADYAIDEYRLFFMTEEDNDNLFVWPESESSDAPSGDTWSNYEGGDPGKR